MNRLRGKLTYSNVISTLCLFLLIGGGTAFAANHLGKNSVGAKQLKKSAVTATKIKNNAVTGAKIKKGAISGSKLAKGAVSGTQIAEGSIVGSKIAAGTIEGSKIAGNTITGANINAGTTPFSQVVARLRTTATEAFGTPTLYPIGSYTQQAGEDDTYLATLTINFAASCEGERSAEAILVHDLSGTPSSFNEIFSHIVGVGEVEEDETSGAATRTLEFSSSSGFGAMASMAPASPTAHSLSAFLIEEECKTGSGITASGGAVDVIGTK
jgi:hypothetical protein